MSKKIGFVGLGQMGRWMASNLIKAGFDLTSFDIDQGAMRFLLDQGAKQARSLPELSKIADWVLLSLPDAEVVERVILGNEGIIDGSKPGQTIVDCGTTDYLATVEISKLLREKRVKFVDAPVTGMDIRAREGTLTIMCGGEEDVVNEVRPALEAIGNNIIYMGDAGKGQLAKLVNQLLYDVNIATLAEILPMAVRLGLEPEKIAQVINTGSGRSFASEFFIPNILENRFDQAYALQKAYKDIISAANISAKCEIPLPIFHAASTTYQMALSNGLGNEDKGAMIKVFERILGVKFRKRS